MYCVADAEAACLTQAAGADSPNPTGLCSCLGLGPLTAYRCTNTSTCRATMEHAWVKGTRASKAVS